MTEKLGSQTANEGTQSESPEALWSQIEKEVDEKVKALWSSAPDYKKEFSDRALEAEHVFVTEVLNAVVRAHAERPGPTTVLFDVDETIAAHRISGANPQGVTIMRPSLIPLLTELKRRGCALGLFTSRGNLAEQMETQTLLGTLKSYLSPELLFSTRDSEGVYGGEWEEILRKEYGGPGGIIADERIPDRFPRTGANASKLEHLKQVRGSLPQGATVIVDDAEYPSILNEKEGFYGVSLSYTTSKGYFIAPS